MIQSPEREITEWQVRRVFSPDSVELAEIGTTPVSRTLIAAAMLLERDGWVQGFGRHHGRHCLVGAISEVSLSYRVEAERELRRHLIGDPIGWNDTPGRTQAEVINLLLEAARSLEAKP